MDQTSTSWIFSGKWVERPQPFWQCMITGISQRKAVEMVNTVAKEISGIDGYWGYFNSLIVSFSLE